MSDEPQPISAAALRGVINGLGGVIANLIIYHAMQFEDHRLVAAARALAVARDSIDAVGQSGASPADLDTVHRLMHAIIDQCEAAIGSEIEARGTEGETS